MKSQILTKINNFIKKRLIELCGILLCLFSLFIFSSIITYSPDDPNFIYSSENTQIKNIGGFYGSVISDFLLQSIGLISILFAINFFYWGFKIILEKIINNFITKTFFLLIYIIFGTLFLTSSYNDSFWLTNYIKIKNKETGLNYSSPAVKAITDVAMEILEIHGHFAAMSYITDKFTGFEFYEGSLNYDNARIRQKQGLLDAKGHSTKEIVTEKARRLRKKFY